MKQRIVGLLNMQQFFISGHSNGHGTVNPNNRLPSTNGRSSDSYSPHNTPSTPNKHVNFGGQGPSEERKREKFLTAKYGAHQMALIRKRLRVEMWMYERLQELYGAVSFSFIFIFSNKIEGKVLNIVRILCMFRTYLFSHIKDGFLWRHSS